MLKVIGGVPDGEYKAVASGTLPNGKPVVVNSDGTVSVANETSYSESLSSGTVFNTGNTIRLAAGFDSVNNKVIIAYHNVSTSTGYAIVGTVSGDTISFGTHVQFENAAVEDLSISVDTANDKVVIFYRDNGNSNYGTAIVGTVSGTSISFGTPVVFASYYSQYNSSVYDTTSGKVIVANRDGSVTDDGSAYVGTVSGTSISFGSAQTFDSGSVGRLALVYDASVDRVVVAYNTGGNVNTKVGTVSGSTISFGSIQNHGGTNIDKVEATGDNNGTIFISYTEGSASSPAYAFLATIGTSSITKGTTVSFDTEVPEMAPVYDSAFDKYVILYRINVPSNAGLYIVGSASGTTLTFETPVTYYNDNAEDVEIAFDSNSNKVVFVYRDSGDGGKGTARVFQNAGSVSNLTAENYIGMSRGVVDSVDAVVGTESVFDTTTAGILDSASVYDPDTQKTIIAYADRDNGDAVTAVVATVTGTTLSFGTPVVADATDAEKIAITYDTTNNKVVITYRDVTNSNYGTSVVGTVSGTSITFGTPVVFHSASTSGRSAITFDENAGKIVIAYTDNANSNYGTAVVGTVSSNSISYGTETVFRSQTSTDTAAAYDANAQKVVIVFRDGGNLNRGTGIVGTVSGTSISFGTRQAFDTTTSPVPEADNTSLVYDPDTQKVICAFRDGNTAGDPGRYIVGTVSGTDISFGNIGIFSEDHVQYVAAAYDTVANKVVIAYRNRDNSDYGTVISGTVDGTDMTFDTPSVYSGTDAVIYIGGSYNEAAGSFVISYRDVTSLDGTAVAYQASYISRYPVADGDPARVDIIGSVSDNQLSLTAGEKYYVQTDGTLSTIADDPSVLAGTAISATKLVVKT